MRIVSLKSLRRAHFAVVGSFFKIASSEFAEHGMRSSWHCQLDNASDNKSRWVIGFFGWCIKQV